MPYRLALAVVAIQPYNTPVDNALYYQEVFEELSQR
jgi:hypothetical protein